MELSEFVRQTLEQIISGTIDAREFAKKKGGQIGSGSLKEVEFDVAVTTTEGSESKKGGGIAVWGVGANIQGNNSSTNSVVSRIKFGVMVGIPQGNTSGQ